LADGNRASVGDVIITRSNDRRLRLAANDWVKNGDAAWPTLRAHLLTLAAETGDHPLRQLLTAASGRDLRTADDMAAVSIGVSQRSRQPTRVRCPGSRAFHHPCMTIRFGAPIWRSDPSWSPILPTRSKITSAKVTAR
jgi:hypothetical protein